MNKTFTWTGVNATDGCEFPIALLMYSSGYTWIQCNTLVLINSSPRKALFFDKTPPASSLSLCFRSVTSTLQSDPQPR